MNENLYSEDKKLAEPYRAAYAASVTAYIDKLRDSSDSVRDAFMTPESLLSDRESYRRRFYDMLGEPLRSYRPDLPLPEVHSELVASDILGEIRRVFFKIDGIIDFYGLLFLPDNFDDKQRWPLVISQHGGDGTPELCSNFFGDTNYSDMTRRVLRRGYVVFAPQLLIWSVPQFGAPFDRGQCDNRLKQLGGSITALEVYCLMRCTDYFASLPYIANDRIGMIGLSYGGFYTLFTAACDTRIKSAYSSCFFNDRKKYNWNDWTWFNACNTFLDAEIAALCAPRRLMIEAGEHDQLFSPDGAEREFNRLLPFYQAAGARENLRLSIFRGDHMLDRNDESLQFFLDGI